VPKTTELQLNRDNLALIEQIVDRHEALCQRAGNQFLGDERLSLTMDLCTANGVNGNRPLDLERLYAADDFNFAHDIVGIQNHMDRTTGKISNRFLPRFTRHDAPVTEAAQ
jgi:hypothetical protein